MKKITGIIEEVSDCLEISAEETNQRAARMVLLYNQSPNISSTYQLRLRKATPIKVLIAMENAIDSLGGGFHDEQLLQYQTISYYSVLFSGNNPQYTFQSIASRDVKAYWHRLEILGLLERKGSKLGLTSDYNEKYILMLANTNDVKSDNTYFKSMFTTLGCAVDTERNLWSKTSYEICSEVGEVLYNSDLLATKRDPRQLEFTHVLPLHENQGVDFYSTDINRLGIPSISPIKPSEVASYNPPVGLPIDPEYGVKIFNEIAKHPFYSREGLIMGYGRPAYEYIRYINKINGSKSPLTIFTSGSGIELIISKAQLNLIEDLTRKKLRTPYLNPAFEPVYNLAADLYYQTQLLNNDDIVRNVLAQLIEESKLKDDKIAPNERAVLEALYKGGGVEYKDGAYDIKNTRILGILSGILEQNFGRISRYINMTPLP